MKNAIFVLEKRQEFCTEIILFSMFQVIVQHHQHLEIDPDLEVGNEISEKDLQVQIRQHHQQK